MTAQYSLQHTRLKQSELTWAVPITFPKKKEKDERKIKLKKKKKDGTGWFGGISVSTCLSKFLTYWFTLFHKCDSPLIFPKT